MPDTMNPDAPAEFDPADVTIRLAGKGDHAVIRDLFLQGLLEGQLRGNDTGADIENLEAGYFSDEGASGFWVATYRNEVVGMIGLQRTTENSAEIRRLRVREAFRRRGVGTRLMQHAIETCRNKGYLKVTLDVRIERGPAIAMFEKCGFALARTRELDGRKTLDFYLDLYRDPRG